MKTETTLAQAELLACLVEELGEAAQIVGKSLRHGLDSYSPLDAEMTKNRTLLARELGDVDAIVRRLVDAGVIDRAELLTQSGKKDQKLRRWTHYQPDSRVRWDAEK